MTGVKKYTGYEILTLHVVKQRCTASKQEICGAAMIRLNASGRFKLMAGAINTTRKNAPKGQRKDSRLSMGHHNQRERANMISLIHNKCGSIAFHYSELPKSGGIIEAKKATNLDGTKPQKGKPILCGSCGEYIGADFPREPTVVDTAIELTHNQFGLELLHGYEPGSEVSIFTQGSSEHATKHKFKEWRGIVSHAHSKLKDGKSAICVFMKDCEPLIITVNEDKNLTVMCYPFNHEAKWQQLLDSAIKEA